MQARADLPSSDSRPERSGGREALVNPDERELARRAADGDSAAFEALVRNHQKRVFNLCFRMLGNRAVAEEIAQEAFVAAYRNLSNFRGDARFGTWLYRIAINRCKNRLAFQNRRHQDGHQSMDEQVRGDEGSFRRQYADPDAENAQAVLEGQERQALVRRAVDRLAADHREILVLRDLEDLSYDEIASMLKLSPGTVKSRLHRARHALKELLRPMMEETE
jgi:RNA polymerase sigma-70 factor (ECF subfamily)